MRGRLNNDQTLNRTAQQSVHYNQTQKRTSLLLLMTIFGNLQVRHKQCAFFNN